MFIQKLLLNFFILTTRKNMFIYNILVRIPGLRYRYMHQIKKWIDVNPEKEIHIKVINKIKMFLTLKDWVQQHLFIYGYYELAESGFWINLVKNKKVIFDIGANVGYFSLLALKNISNESGLIYAFEPVSHTFDRAKYNIELNKFKNINLYKIALTDKKGKLEINVGDEKNWGMSSINKHNYLSGKTEIADAETVDGFIEKNKITALNLVKIDVEGSEFLVLKGMINSLSELRPIILIEVLDINLNTASTTKEQVFGFLLERNYKAYKIINRTNLEPLINPVSLDGLIYFHPNEKSFDSFVKVIN